MCISFLIYLYHTYFQKGSQVMIKSIYKCTCFLGGSDSKESAYNARDQGSIPGLERSPGREGMATHSSILTWRIPWTEEPGGLQSMWLQTTEQLSTAQHECT